MNWVTARTLCVLAVWVLVVPAAGAATRQQELDQLVTKYHQLRQFHGTVLVANEKGVLYKKGHGFANLEWRVPNTPDTKFRLGSITKQFTSMLIMQLVAEGKLKLDDKLTKHLPDYRKDTGDRVTVTHLLNHTSGIPSYTSLPGFFENESRNRFTVSDLVKKFCSGDLNSEPGTKYAYNNSGYVLLGAIIEKVTGKTYAQALQERIFDPLGMKSTGYDVSSTVLPKRASGYEFQPDGYFNAAYLDMTVPYAAGALYSTVEDLYLWDRALYLDTLLPAPLKQRMFTPGLNNYAFGWSLRPIPLQDGTELAAVSHGGGVNGFSTLLIRIPERKELVVLLDNASSGGKLSEIAAGLLGILRGIPPLQPRPSVGEVVWSTLDKASVTEAIARYRVLKTTKTEEYDFSEEQLMGVGYRLLRAGRVADAIEIFKLNVETYPTSANCHDSLGEAYLASGNKEQALASYRKVLELLPGNNHAQELIKKLAPPASSGSNTPALKSKP
ncbi:serine hydrolase [Pyxidicoccus trucidator]|uniref:serine hydrolase n=1 Tax=Pyxidicoccus trucidator TaxID=2709662 RepID=UPI0013DBACA0|nr:serine hydrolase [Pyxidicoccus trucidator]